MLSFHLGRLVSLEIIRRGGNVNIILLLNSAQFDERFGCAWWVAVPISDVCWHSLRVCQEQEMTAKWAFHTLNVAVGVSLVTLFKSLGGVMIESPELL